MPAKLRAIADQPDYPGAGSTKWHMTARSDVFSLSYLTTYVNIAAAPGDGSAGTLAAAEAVREKDNDMRKNDAAETTDATHENDTGMNEETNKSK